MNASETSFFVTGGTLRYDAPSYVERHADRQLWEGLIAGEFCYVLTSRQMGKSSLMVRAASRLRDQSVRVLILDLTAIGQDLTREQWYDGLMAAVGRQLGCEVELEEFWSRNARLPPVQRFFAAIRESVMNRLASPLVVFVDELDTVRSLDFATDEFFAAIRECYNRRAEDPVFRRLTFCLLGVATPSELIKDPRTTPFNIGRRIELDDFRAQDATPLASGLRSNLRFEISHLKSAEALLHRILYWTGGHPYLTQRFCRAVAEAESRDIPPASGIQPPALIDRLGEELFLSSRARETDDNLLYVRERLLRTRSNLASLLDLHSQVLGGYEVPDDGNNDLINELRLAGMVRVENGRLRVRNRIYERVFDSDWVRQNMPDVELEKREGFGKQAGERFRIKGSCSFGRSSSNGIQLADDKVSRRHALIHAQGQNEFWLVDFGSSNGTYLNGRRVRHPTKLHSQDEIQLGPFRLRFCQSKPRPALLGKASLSTTVQEIKSTNCWMLVAALDSTVAAAPSLSDEELARRTGQWIASCKPIIEESGGEIFQFFGHGFLACWPESNDTDDALTQALPGLKRLQEEARPFFHMAVHHGQIIEAGTCVPGEENVVGSDVNFALGMGRLAAVLGESCLLSERARRRLGTEVPANELARYPIPGFSGKFLFFSF